MASAVISYFAYAVRKARRVEVADPAWLEAIEGIEQLLKALHRARQNGEAPAVRRPRSGIPHGEVREVFAFNPEMHVADAFYHLTTQ
eukprot:12923849-Prorocentrum_lima.AAC.1